LYRSGRGHSHQSCHPYYYYLKYAFTDLLLIDITLKYFPLRIQKG
jgi:hypothetical protein